MRNLRSRLTYPTNTYSYDDLPGNHSTFSLGYTIVPIRKHHTIHDNNCQICHSTASQSQANRVVAERRLERGGRLATAAALGRARRSSARLGPARSAHLRRAQQNRTESCLAACLRACCLDTTMPSSAARLTTGNTRVSLHTDLLFASLISWRNHYIHLHYLEFRCLAYFH